MTQFKNLLMTTLAAGSVILPFSAQAADPAPVKAAVPAFTEEQNAALEDYVRNFILNNPEVLMESVNRYREKMAVKETEDAQKKLVNHKEGLYNGGHPEIGNPKGDVTVVEFFDYNCGYCKRALETVTKTVENDKNVRVIFIDMPILSPTSTLASKWALAAKKQGKYWELHQALMNSSAPKDEENMEKLAKEAGLDVEKLKKDAADPVLDDVLKKNADIAKDLGINGTPGFVVGDEILRGFMEYDGFKTVVQNARAKTGKK